MFQAIPEHIEKLPMSIFFLADVEEALVHGIACLALFFFCFMAGCLFGFVDLLVCKPDAFLHPAWSPKGVSKRRLTGRSGIIPPYPPPIPPRTKVSGRCEQCRCTIGKLATCQW